MKRTVILVADPYPPYQYLDRGEIVGVDHDLIRAAFQVSNVAIEVRLYQWDECVAQLENGEADGLFQIQPTPERKQQFLFSKLLRTAQTVCLQNRSNPIPLAQFQTIGQLMENCTVGMVKDYAYHPDIDGLDHANKVAVSSQKGLLEGISLKAFDLALMDRGVAEYLMRQMDISEVVISSGFEIERQLHVAFKKTLTNLVTQFNTGLEKIGRQGIQSAIYARYHLSE